MSPAVVAAFDFLPVTAGRIDDLRRFSEAHGTFRYCSCMHWRLTSGEFRRSTKKERVARFEDLPWTGTLSAFSATSAASQWAGARLRRAKPTARSSGRGQYLGSTTGGSG